MAYFYTNLHTKTKGIRFLLLSLVSILNLFQVHSQSRLAFMHGDDGNSGAGTGLSAWVSNGDGTFKQCKLFDTGFNRDNSGSEVFGEDGAQQTFFVDVTGDGLVDIVHVTEYGGNAIYVYRGLGTGSFSKTAIASTGMTATTSGTFTGVSGGEQGFVADVTGDGKLDYVQSGDDNKIHVFLGNGNGTFQTSHTTTNLTGNNGSNSSGISTTEAAFLIDVNGDGKADLVETNEGDNRSIRVWLATTAGSFATAPLSTTNFQQTASSIFRGRGGNETVDMKDVNGDGKVDFVAANEFDSNIDFFVYLGNGDGTFFTTYIRSVVTNPAGTYFQVVGDYDAEQGQTQPKRPLFKIVKKSKKMTKKEILRND